MLSIALSADSNPGLKAGLRTGVFWLKVSRFESLCQFELSWGEGQCITARHSYPPTLDPLYQDWQQAYLNFYQSREPLSPDPAAAAQMRAYRVQSGSISPQIDWQSWLSDAEAALLLEFRDWLAEGALREIRRALIAAARSPDLGQIELFLSCEPPDLVRLPWESWQVSDDLTMGEIRLVRVPSSIRNRPVSQRARWKRARILAICCDDAGLDLGQEKQILKSLEPLVSVQIVGWDSPDATQRSAADRRAEILAAIANPTGWDMLFFAGHSDETQATSGMLAIAPNAHITIAELQPYLETAKSHGLQLALFNSCSGLQIAAALIDLGLNEVIVMRERIHSEVAQAFLVQVARSLRAYKDAHTAMLDARQLLLDRRLDYPSAYLVPSLFRRPGAPSFVLSPPSWRQGLDWLWPKPREAVALLLCCCLSLLPGVQTGLLDGREWIQAEYRQVTHQVESGVQDLALVRIDDASIQKDRQGEQMMAGSVFPISQRYMGRLIEALAERNVRAIGIDYVIDDPDPRGAEHTLFLAQSIRQAAERGSRFVFAKILNPNSSIWMQTMPELIQPMPDSLPSLEAPAIRALGDNFHMPLQSNFDASLELPFSYWLSWLHRSQTLGEAAPHWPLYRLPLGELLDALAGKLAVYPMWFHAITDFSLPPEQVYREISAWKLLQADTLSERLNDLPLSAIITAGGYPEAGIAQTDNGVGYIENFTPPKAMRHWYGRQPENRYRQMTGGEHLGYLFYHFLHRRFVVPVPDLLLVLLAAAIAKLALIGLSALARPAHLFAVLGLAGGMAFYVLISLQLYVSSAAVLLPIGLPLAVFWLYLLPRFAP